MVWVFASICYWNTSCQLIWACQHSYTLPKLSPQQLLIWLPLKIHWYVNNGLQSWLPWSWQVACNWLWGQFQSSCCLSHTHSKAYIYRYTSEAHQLHATTLTQAASLQSHAQTIYLRVGFHILCHICAMLQYFWNCLIMLSKWSHYAFIMLL